MHFAYFIVYCKLINDKLYIKLGTSGCALPRTQILGHPFLPVILNTSG
eukprot:SAG31_NODE_43690_length_266_cov_0.610778_1_plen_47_part_01